MHMIVFNPIYLKELEPIGGIKYFFTLIILYNIFRSPKQKSNGERLHFYQINQI